MLPEKIRVQLLLGLSPLETFAQRLRGNILSQILAFDKCKRKLPATINALTSLAFHDHELLHRKLKMFVSFVSVTCTKLILFNED